MTKLHFADLVQAAKPKGNADGSCAAAASPAGEARVRPRAKLTSEAAWRLRLEGLAMRERDNAQRHRQKKDRYEQRVAEHLEGLRAVRDTRRKRKEERFCRAEERARSQWEADIEAREEVNRVLSYRLQATEHNKQASLGQLSGTTKLINHAKHSAMSEYKGAFREQANSTMTSVVDRLGVRPPNPNELSQTVGSIKYRGETPEARHAFNVSDRIMPPVVVPRTVSPALEGQGGGWGRLTKEAVLAAHQWLRWSDKHRNALQCA